MFFFFHHFLGEEDLRWLGQFRDLHLGNEDARALVVAREAGQQPSFEEVRQAIGLTLRQQAWVNALRQYLQLLAGAAVVEGVVLDAADSPLVQ